MDLERPHPPLAAVHPTLISLKPPAGDRLQAKPWWGRGDPELSRAHERKTLCPRQLKVVAHGAKAGFAVQHEADRVLSVRLAVDPALHPHPPPRRNPLDHLVHAHLRSPYSLERDPRAQHWHGLRPLVRQARIWLAGLEVGPRADLLSAACGAYDAGQSHVAIRGACTAARADQHALAITEKAVVSR
jgi:hypothetical protein